MRTFAGSFLVSVFPLTLLLAPTTAVAQESIALATDVSGTIGAEGEVDWYMFTTDVLGDLLVTQTAWPGFIETRVELYGPDTQTTLQSNRLDAAAPGTYYVKVYSANNLTSTELYTFNVTLAPAATGNDADSGGNSVEAALTTSIGDEVSDTIGPSSVTAGVQDEDWYTVTTEVVGDLAITQTEWPGFIETRISVFGPDDPTLPQGTTIDAAAPGTYYLRVWSAVDGASSEIYTFHTSLEEAGTGNDVDGGANAPAGAVPITLGATVRDTIAPSKETAGIQDEDWYVLTLDRGGELSVTQTEWPGFIETRLAVFGPNSTTTPFANPAVPGNYYVRMWSANDGSSIDPYAFTTALVPDGTVGGTGGSGAGGASTGGGSGAEVGGGTTAGGAGTDAPSGAGTDDGSGRTLPEAGTAGVSPGSDTAGGDSANPEAGGAGTDAPSGAGTDATEGGATGEGASAAEDAGASSEGSDGGDGGDEAGTDDAEPVDCACSAVGKPASPVGSGGLALLLGLALGGTICRRRGARRR